MESLLEARNISKTFPGVRALAGVELSVRAGEVHALLGENGAGKSTLIKIVTGVLAPDPGASLVICGRRVEKNSVALADELGVSAIYQHPTLFGELSVLENLTMGQSGFLIDWKARRRFARDCLERVGADIPLDRPVKHLRMAEKQLIEVARALSRDARLLIMDEPTAALPKQDADHLLGLIRRLRERGVGIVYISHRLEEVLDIADRMTVLRDGRLVGTYEAKSLDRQELIRLMAGRSLEAMYAKQPVRIGQPVLEVANLSCAAGGIAGIGFTVHAGEILGVAGLVGAGRTELARTLFGITPADGGSIALAGSPVAIRSPGDAIALGLAYVPEDRHLHGVIQDLPVVDNAMIAILDQFLRCRLLDRDREVERAAAAVRQLGVKTPSVFTPVRSLSGGNQQKVALARWLAIKPKVLILDEPTQGIDVGAKAEIYRLVEDLAQAGMGILMISSDLPEILGLADRVAVMRGGRLVAVLDRAEASQEKVLELALEQKSAAEEPVRA
ncbi:MAG: sugar ABC transporter ATP-binding protein [Lentisphaeria bacterium]|jgi:rhamnose transport system ATP-binding protein|nr:sugar ABC transporter ATP-binding protein [Lentisphaeria bacterium]